jgi:4-amino-4-deoxy-L-arabinose transferase-like glycosyltransferase
VLEQECKSPGRTGLRPFWPVLWESRKYFLLVTLAAFALRLFFFVRFPHVTGDSLIYGDIAKNWLSHGIYGLSRVEGPQPTWIRLPGYPAFLAACFALFGSEHYHAVLLVQIVVDVACCFFVADLARRTVSGRAGRLAFLLAALCPFTANYAVAPLAETLSIFLVAVALDCAVAAFTASDEGHNRWTEWTWCGLAVSAGITLRPDGGILLVAIGLFLLWRMWRRPAERARLFGAGVLVLTISMAPLVPWTLRNWHDFHRFEPLAPRYANDSDEFVPEGFDKWVRTWIVDFVSTDEIYWNIPGDTIDLHLLPSRAFDSAEQREKTEAIFRDYDKIRFVNPELSARFGELANERIRAHPFRYYVWLPILRIGDMWVRPRAEMLPVTSRWWEYWNDRHDFVVAAIWGVLNLLFLFAAVMGVVRGPRPRYLPLMLLFVLLRSAFLGSLENPEPRYTLECYPVVFVLGAAWISGWEKQAAPGKRAAQSG